MNRLRLRTLPLIGILPLLFAVAGSVQAQDYPPPNDKPAMSGMHGAMRENLQGQHNMPATVNAVDAKTGLVDVTAGGMALKLHFPPPAVAGLKAGDQITLHLAYSKP
jgi:hypothetical protein